MRIELTISEFFRDMFDLPASDLNIDPFQPIFIDEKSEVLAIMISDLRELSCQSETSSAASHGIATDYSVMLAHDKFQATEGLIAAQRRLECSLSVNPFAGFAIASRSHDLRLGRRAIRHINLQVINGGQLDFWHEIADAKPSWQLALAQLVMPLMSRYPDSQFAGRKSFTMARVKNDSDDIASAFNPK